MNRIATILLAGMVAGCAVQKDIFIMPPIVSVGQVNPCPVTVVSTDKDGNEVVKTVDSECVTELKRDHCVKIAVLLNECIKTSTLAECHQPWMETCFAIEAEPQK